MKTNLIEILTETNRGRHCTLEEMKAVCDYFGIDDSGTKLEMWQRLDSLEVSQRKAREWFFI